MKKIIYKIICIFFFLNVNAHSQNIDTFFLKLCPDVQLTNVKTLASLNALKVDMNSIYPTVYYLKLKNKNYIGILKDFTGSVLNKKDSTGKDMLLFYFFMKENVIAISQFVYTIGNNYDTLIKREHLFTEIINCGISNITFYKNNQLIERLSMPKFRLTNVEPKFYISFYDYRDGLYYTKANTFVLSRLTNHKMKSTFNTNNIIKIIKNAREFGVSNIKYGWSKVSMEDFHLHQIFMGHIIKQ
jgi:hypothetical protein